MYCQVISNLQQDYIADCVHSVEQAGKCMNHWLNVVPCTANNSILGRNEFWDMVLLRYQITPKDLPTACNDCGKKYILQHALQCKKGGLIGGNHDDYHNDLRLVASQAYSPSSVHNNPLITKGWDTEDRVQNLAKQPAPVKTINQKDKENNGLLYSDLMIWHLWQSQIDTIIDVQITNTDAKLYISWPL
eukprot:5292808-Ditylum_brightwellii.AAC.1